MKISRLRRTLAVFLSAMLVMLCMPLTAITASALAAAKKEVNVLELYPSGCLKTITVLFQADGTYGEAYGKIGIQKQATSMDYLNPYIPGTNNGATAPTSESWPATVDKEGFIAFGEGAEFRWSEAQECKVTVQFGDGAIDLKNTQDYYIYLWTRSPQYGIYPDLLLRTLKTENGKLLDENGNTIVEENTHSHSWSTQWTSNGTHHWHECTAEGCPVTNDSEKDGYEGHISSGSATEDSAEYCTVCRYVINPKLPHTHKFGEWTIVKAPTTTEEGLLERVCECGEKETKVIPKLVDKEDDPDDPSDPDDDDNDSGKIVDTTPDGNVGGATLDDVKNVAENIPLDPDDYIAMLDGDDLNIYLEVVDVTDASEDMSDEDKALIESEIAKVEDMKQGMLIDVSLYKQIGNNAPKKVTNTKAPITITFEMPESLINTDDKVERTYFIIRVHNGEEGTEVATISGVFDTASKTFSFETDRFSSYAIAYKDVATAAYEPTPSSDSTPAHSHIYKYNHDEKDHWQECSCGSVRNKTPHTFGEWVTVKEPTEDEDGLKKRTCEICGYSENCILMDVSSGAGEAVENDSLDMTEKDFTLAITFAISAAVIGMTIAKRRKVRN